MIQRNRFMSGKADRRRPVLAVGTCIGKRIEINCLDRAVFHASEPHVHLHFVAVAAGGNAFFPRIDNL